MVGTFTRTQTIKANGNEPLMVTIAWTDRAGVTNTKVQLILKHNDNQ
jgi:hypothetical protein